MQREKKKARQGRGKGWRGGVGGGQFIGGRMTARNR